MFFYLRFWPKFIQDNAHFYLILWETKDKRCVKYYHESSNMPKVSREESIDSTKGLRWSNQKWRV